MGEEDGVDPEVAAVNEEEVEEVEPANPDQNSEKTPKNQNLYRECDEFCDIPAEWEETLLVHLRRLSQSSFSTYLEVGRLVAALDALEECSQCDSLLAPRASVIVSIGGNGCQPVNDCTDFIRWLRWNITPHFTKVRTLLRQLYKFREGLHLIIRVSPFLFHAHYFPILLP